MVDYAEATGGDQRQLFAGEQLASLTAAAHELKTPLATTQYLSALLMGDDSRISNEERQAYLWQIRLSAQRGMQLIDGLTQLFSTSQIQLNLETVNVANVCEDVLHDLTPLTRELSQSVELSLPRHAPLALAHHTVLRSVVTNLCDNALKHNPPESRVRVIISETSNNIRIAVRDNGPKMGAQDFKNLKNRLGKEVHPLGGRSGSSGLGLYIASKLSKAMRGQLELTRHHGQGVTFALRLQPSYQLTLL
jgi:signal transduction histidine kinase